MMACSTAPQFSFPRTTSSTSPSQILMGASTASAPSAPPNLVAPGIPSTGSSSGILSSSTPPRIGGGSPPTVPQLPPPTASSSSSPGPPHPAPASAGGATPTTTGGGCCESGRPILTVSGQTVCSCQYDAAYQRLAAAAAAAAALPGSSMYATAAATAPYPPPGSAAAAAAAAVAAAEQGAYLPLSAAADQSAFYSPNANGFDLKENLEAWRSLAAYPSAMYYPYESPLAGYPFANGYGVDLNGARRKNATRETTSTLKAWLSEHRKNPYPTKGEKIMLAIITKMTLTQVSTWFANARRRLKKENKMTWEPRNRCDDDDDDLPTNDSNDPDNMCNSGDEDPSKDSEIDVGDRNSDIDCKDSILDVDDSMKCPPVREHPLLRLQQSTGHGIPPLVMTSSPATSTTSTTPTKPRIWSIVDTATSSDDKSTSSHNRHIPSSVSSAKIQRSRLDYAPPILPYHKPMPSWYPGLHPDIGSSRIPSSFHNGLIYSTHHDRRSPPHLQPQIPLSSAQRLSLTSATSTASVTSSSPPSSPENTKNSSATDNL